MAKKLYEEASVQAIANAIRAKSGTTGTMTLAEMPGKIAAIQTGGSGSSSTIQNDINFYDYDDTLIASYSLSEAQSLTALPDAPIHEGLTFQGWNYTLEKVKAFTRPMNVGAMYITNDGKTRLYIRIATEGRMNVPLYISQTVANGVTIDWGDGSATETLAGIRNVNTTHTYASIGDYTITLDPVGSCTLGFGDGSSSHCVLGSTSNNGRIYCNFLKSVRIGDGVTRIGTGAFYDCNSLASINISESVTSIDDYAFQNCYSLASITIPDGVTSIGTGAFQNCPGMAEYHLESTTPPALSGTNAFSGIPSDCIIYVPHGCLEAYQNATNWATYTSYMREEPA